MWLGNAIKTQVGRGILIQREQRFKHRAGQRKGRTYPLSHVLRARDGVHRAARQQSRPRNAARAKGGVQAPFSRFFTLEIAMIWE
jgi:hypothetical protein